MNRRRISALAALVLVAGLAASYDRMREPYPVHVCSAGVASADEVEAVLLACMPPLDDRDDDPPPALPPRLPLPVLAPPLGT